MLPDEIYRKILLYNIHNVAEILKPVIKEFDKDCKKYNMYDTVGFYDYYTIYYLPEYNPKIFLKRENRIHQDWMQWAYSPK